MEDIDELLRTNICIILNSISDETINDIIQAVKYVGLESLSDLQFVQEEDLMLVLRPIPRRKLVKAWSEQIVLPSSASGSSLHFALTAPDSPSLHFSPPAPDSPPPKSGRIFKKSSLKCKWSWTNRYTLLQTYIKYMKKLSSPNVDKQSVWEKIAKEVREKCSMNCDAAQCRHKIDGLRSTYERIKDKNVINRHAIMFLNEARKAFMDEEKSVTPNPQVEVNVETDRYVAPFMREDANMRGESMALSRDESATVRVKNLSENVKDSDLRKLFRPFGPIARVFIAKDKLTGLPKGVAFIKYHRHEDASRAVAVDGFEYDNQILKVEWARPL